jgi:hypothetical protein
MDPTVWAWANDDVDAKTALLKRCSNGNCDAVELNVAQFKRCSACKEVSVSINTREFPLTSRIGGLLHPGMPEEPLESP